MFLPPPSGEVAARRAGGEGYGRLRNAQPPDFYIHSVQNTKNHQEKEKFSTGMGKRVTTAVTKMTIRLQKWKKP
jgi:hypothetical protein